MQNVKCSVTYYVIPFDFSQLLISDHVNQQQHVDDAYFLFLFLFFFRHFMDVAPSLIYFGLVQ